MNNLLYSLLCWLLVPLILTAGEAPKLIVVPFELLPTNHIAVQIKVNGKGPYRVIFDTGAPVILLNTKVGKESGIIGKGGQTAAFNLLTMGQVKIKSLEVGNVKAENLSTIVLDHPTVTEIAKYFGPIEGIVGFPFFARYKTTIDYKAKRMTFIPNGYKPNDSLEAMVASIMALGNERPKAKLLAADGLWGIELAKNTKDRQPGSPIKTVLANSPAAKAGLKAGDRILTIGGRWTDSAADVFIAAGHSKSGVATKIGVLREGKEMDISLIPQPGF